MGVIVHVCIIHATVERFLVRIRTNEQDISVHGTILSKQLTGYRLNYQHLQQELFNSMLYAYQAQINAQKMPK